MTPAAAPACSPIIVAFQPCHNRGLPTFLQDFVRQLVNNPFGMIFPLLLFVGTVVSGLILRRILFRFVRGWAARTDSSLDALMRETLRGPIFLWAVILGVHLATQNSDIPRPYLRFVAPTLEVLWILSLTIAMSRLAGNAVRFYGGRVTGAPAVTSLTQKLAQLVVVMLGAVWTLKVVFDLNLTPILTTLGVGGLAVALALQDTLTNLFAGFYVSISGLVRIGDYISLNTNEEGYVTDINWRCTTMRSQSNSLVVIPNAKLGQAIYTNYSLPESRLASSVIVTVGFSSDVDLVEIALRDEAASAVRDIPGALVDPVPFVLFTPGPGELGIGFQITFYIAGYSHQKLAQSEMRKRLYKRLKRDGIATWPVRANPTEENKAETKDVPE